MCTVIVLRGLNPDHPLVVAANRDEHLVRPYAPPAEILPGVIAPRDEIAGGTWMGATAGGFFAALTNIHTGAARAPRSRGEVVVGALRAGSVDAATAYLATLPLAELGAFNLLFGDAARVRVAHAPPGVAHPEIEEVGPGLHVLPNGPLNTPLFPKVERARALVAPIAGLPFAELLPRLHAALADHEGATPHAALCVHTPAHGTTSSTVLAIDPGRTVGYWFGDGPPCRSRLTSALTPS